MKRAMHDAIDVHDLLAGLPVFIGTELDLGTQLARLVAEYPASKGGKDRRLIDGALRVMERLLADRSGPDMQTRGQR